MRVLCRSILEGEESLARCWLMHASAWHAVLALPLYHALEKGMLNCNGCLVQERTRCAWWAC